MATMQIHGGTQIRQRTITATQLAESANIELSQLLAGSNIMLLDGTRAFTGNVSMATHRLLNLPTPVADHEPATKGYVDIGLQGLITKDAVKAATTENITLSGEQTLDGIALVAGDRALVKDQTNKAQNGIYVVSVGAWARSADFDGTPVGEVKKGSYVYVQEGGQAGNGFTLATSDPIAIGTTELTFTQFSGAGQIQAGSALGKTGNQLYVVADEKTLSTSGNQVHVAAAGINGTHIAADSIGPSHVNASAIGAGLAKNSTSGVVEVDLDGTSIEINGNGKVALKDGGIATAKMADDSVTRAKINADVAGSGLVQGVSGELKVDVDGSSVEVSGTNKVQLKDSGVSTAKIADLGVTKAKINSDVAGDGLAKDGTTGALKVQTGNGVELDGTKKVQIKLDGNTLALGASGVKLADLAEGHILVGNSSSVATARRFVREEAPNEAADGSRVAFTFDYVPQAGTFILYRNGIRLRAGASYDYTLSGLTVTFATAPTSEDYIVADYIAVAA